jgi:hypothetical protein
MKISGNKSRWLLAVTAMTVFSSAVQAQEEDIGASAAKTSQHNASAKADLKQGNRYYVKTDVLNVRNSPSKTGKKLGELALNDEVEVIEVGDNSNSMVEIKIIASNGSVVNADLATKLYVAGDFLSSEKSQNPVVKGQPSKFIVIQNIASERLRIYERCTESSDCAHRLVYETEQVAGRPEGPKEDSDRYVSWLGHYKISKWVKFYEDNQDHYPSWYHPNYPAPPKRGSDPKAWISKKYIPNPGVGAMRGAFGWYAAMVSPNANSQWLHGTMGWGSDGDAFIKWTRSWLVNLFADPRSSGCSRLENRAIAYVRNMVGPGTEVFRVYAIEGYRDPKREAYENQRQPKPWDFILTKEGYQKDGPTSDRASVLARNVPKSEYLEEGRYDADQYPNAIALKTNASSGEARSGKSGNTYRISDNKFRGVFLVDEGRFIGYSHPQGLQVGGFPNKQLPAFLVTSGDYTDARKAKETKQSTNKTSRPGQRNGHRDARTNN